MSHRTSLVLAALVGLALLPACGGGGGGGASLAAPTGLQASPTSSTSVALTWTAPAGAVLGYELERATGGGAFAPVASPAATATGHGDGGLTTGTTYRWRLRAVGADGASAWSGEASATPAATAPAAPFPPGGLLVTALGAAALRVEWIDQSDDETGFEIERAASAAGPFGQVGTAAADAQAYHDAGLQAGTTYHYRVRAVNAAGVSAYASVVAGTTAAAVAPAAPTGLAAVQDLAGGDIVIRLGWTDAATDETGYEVQRSADGAAWEAAEALPAGSASYVDPAPLPLATNWYRVRAVNGAAASAWAEAHVYNGPMLLGYLCPDVTGVSAVAQGTSAVRIGWTWNVCNGVGVERATSAAGPWSEVARLGNYFFPAPATGTWDDTGLAAGTTYHYRLRSLPLFVGAPPSGGTWSPSGYAAVVSAATGADLGTPSGLAASGVTGTTATLTWTGAAGAEGYAVDVATAAAGPFAEAFRVGTGTSTGVAGLTPGTAYWLRVRALKGGASSAPSNVVTFTTASTIVLRTTGDAVVMASTAVSANQNVNISGDFDAVGCYFQWVVGPTGQGLFHNCGITALRFDTSALAGKSVIRASLVMWPCGLAPDPVGDATYAVWAASGPWNPATVTYNTLPSGYTAGASAIPAPTAAGAQTWDVTTIVRNWVAGTWSQNGLLVGQSPITDRIPTWGGQQWDHQDQTTNYCSLERTGGSVEWAPALHVEVR